MLLLLTLFACPTTTDTGSTKDSDTAVAAECSELTSATDWYWDGACPQMITPCDIAVTDCSLVIDYTTTDDGMTMGMPYDGVIDGDTITFGQGEDWGPTDCVGTIISPDEVTGTCNGCDFTLKRDI